MHNDVEEALGPLAMRVSKLWHNWWITGLADHMTDALAMLSSNVGHTQKMGEDEGGSQGGNQSIVSYILV